MVVVTVMDWPFCSFMGEGAADWPKETQEIPVNKMRSAFFIFDIFIMCEVMEFDPNQPRKTK
jgi:hypothetical protein